MKPILLTYATLAGSTREVADAIGEEIRAAGWPVEVRPMAEIREVEGYAAVVAGGPMILGWHRSALGFLRRNWRAWQRTPLAVFVLAMSLTQTDDMGAGGVPLVVDEKLPKPPTQPGRLTFRERYATLGNYLGPILGAVKPAQPAAMGVFGGRLEFGRLPWWAVIFAMVLVRAAAGERRNWPAIRAWAADLPRALNLELATDAAPLVAV